jgi:hypothetical protein
MRNPKCESLGQVDDNLERTPELERELILRIDIQAEYEAVGFRPLPGAVPNKDGWLEGKSLSGNGNIAFINVGMGPERGMYFEHLPEDFRRIVSERNRLRGLH